APPRANAVVPSRERRGAIFGEAGHATARHHQYAQRAARLVGAGRSLARAASDVADRLVGLPLVEFRELVELAAARGVGAALELSAGARGERDDEVAPLVGERQRPGPVGHELHVAVRDDLARPA